MKIRRPDKLPISPDDKSAEHTATQQIWKIRTVKEYAQAHNHIMVGRVLEVNSSFVRLRCKSYHFHPSAKTPDDIQEGVHMVRIIPWHKIEIVNELSPTFGYYKSRITTDQDGSIVLNDDTMLCTLVSCVDRRY